MKYGLLGDIHANLSALEAALDHLDSAGAEVIVSLGDVVGYGAAPGPCIRRLREQGVVVVRGNHDAAVAGQLDLRRFHPFARSSALWTRDSLGREERAWLGTLPYRIDLEACSAAHGAYHAPEEFRYVRCPADADPSLDALPRPVGFVGHTHLPVTLMRLSDDPHRTAYSTDIKVDLSGAQVSLINVGSVGQPRDGDPRATCALFDPEAELVELMRVEYDIEREVSRLCEAGLPTALGERLRKGI
jgi:predicted phosphodiesterase